MAIFGQRHVAVLGLLAASALFADTTYTFTNGAKSYSGSGDVSINTQYSQYNGGNGTLWTGDPELGVYNVSGTNGYSTRYLLKFSGLAIPAGSTVASATLTLTLDSWNQGGNVTGFYLKNSWDPTSSKIGWIHRDATNNWAAAGASSAGVDTVAGKTFQLPAQKAVGIQTITIPLDKSVVQSWVDSPTANQGIMLVNNVNDQTVRLVSTVGTQANRPKLTIVTGSGSVTPLTVSPTTVSLSAGQTQQFTASTAVSWTATGGTITSAGLFTAGTAAGSFTVTAKSTADTTKTASATVTITVPTPPVTVSVSPTTATVLAGKTQQFSANIAVTWSATGGTISTAGLYTAGSSAGVFAVTATSVQDTTKKATAKITVTVPQPVSVTIAPTTTTLFPNGTQQFTANVGVTWAATGGAVSSTGLYTAGSTTGSFTVTATSVQDPTRSASASVTILTQTTSGRPRIILDAPTLATLRNRMSAKTAEWTAVKAVCDSYIGGTAQFINGNDYPNKPNVGEGYQGDGYLGAIMPLGLCYQTVIQSDPNTAAKYAATAVSVLMAMSDPNNQTASDCSCAVPLRDDGYGLRNFGVAMGIGYDWFHDVLTSAQQAQIRTALTAWFTTFETNSKVAFEYDHPQGNYFAGYYNAKCMSALAVQGDDPIGDTWWNDWYNHQHLQRVAPYYTANLAGGGWLEGFAQYGNLGSENQSLPALAVRTAKNIDIINDPAHPYKYPLDNPRYLIHFTWPTRDIIDDRGELYSTGDPNVWPGTASADIYRFYAGFLAMWNDPLAPYMHKYARDVKAALDVNHNGGTTPWIDFLFWDASAAEADYSTLPASNLAPGIAGIAARSDWTTGATFMSFLSGPYINNPSAGHENFEKGSIAIERNRNPLLVNPAWMAHEPGGDAGWNLTYTDRYGNWNVDPTQADRRLYNTFQVRHLSSTGTILDEYGEIPQQRTDGARTTISRYEDGGSYVLSVGQYLEDMYRPFQTICQGGSPIKSWSREVVYLRPSQFVVYDRTNICNSSLDQYLAFHFPANPAEVTAPASGEHRLDVNTGQFAGTMTTILPANAALVTTSQFSSDTTTYNKMWRTEIRPSDAASTNRQWLTVFDLATSSAQVASATSVNFTSGAAIGALLQSASGNSAVIAGTAAVGTPISTLSYTIPAAQTLHVITDLAPSTGYTVTTALAGTNITVTIAQGGGTVSSANGALSFVTNASGAIAH